MWKQALFSPQVEPELKASFHLPLLSPNSLDRKTVSSLADLCTDVMVKQWAKVVNHSGVFIVATPVAGAHIRALQKKLYV